MNEINNENINNSNPLPLVIAAIFSAICTIYALVQVFVNIFDSTYACLLGEAQGKIFNMGVLTFISMIFSIIYTSSKKLCRNRWKLVIIIMYASCVTFFVLSLFTKGMVS